tara:strand:+ start:788 stop:1684 length:897 start_codon:yes stop_codon:yes gene_type:complete
MITLFNNIKINFTEKFKIAGKISILLILVGIFLLFFKGLELGIDFKGGTEVIIENTSNKSFSIDNFRSLLDDNDIVYSSARKYGKTQIQLRSVNQIDITALKSVLVKTNEYEFKSASKMTATATERLKNDAIKALSIAILLIGLYIIVRFDWYTAVGGISALIHDVFITITMLMFFSYEFNIKIVAAILLVIGYSLNDTIVVFDRMRENIKEYANMKLYEIINLSLNETLGRTIITSLTTLLVIVPLFIFGGETLKGLSFALMIGVLSGTYSSIFVATPIMMALREKYYSEENEQEGP